MQQAHSRRGSALTMRKASSGVEAKQSNDGLACLGGKIHKKQLSPAVICGLFCFCLISSSYSLPLVNVNFSGDNGQLSNYYSSVENDLNYAAADWEKFFVSGNAS